MLPPTIPYLYMCIYQGKCSIKQNEEAYSTWYSQAVSHPSTNQAGPCLASEIRRDRAYWGWYGRNCMLPPTIPYLYMWIYDGKCSIKQNEEAYSTWYSQAVSHPSTNQAGSFLASEIRRDRAYWGWFGRNCTLPPTIPYLYMWIYQGKCSIKQNGEAYSTWYSQAVSHPSTYQAGPCLASEIRQDQAYSGWYGRMWMLPPTIPYLYMWIYQGKCSIKQNEEAYSTWYSQAVSHPSTNQAGPCLASEIRRDRAYWGWYGRNCMLPPTIPYLYMWIYQGKCSIKQNEEAYSTWYSQAVSHPSTNQSGDCLASEIRRDRAHSGWYGRKWMLPPTIPYLYMWIYQGKCSIKQNEEAYSTWYSQAVSHPSTNQAGPCLASEIRRDRAYWGWYGRKWMLPPTIPYLYMWIYQGKCSIKQNGEAYSNWYSQAVSHPSTNKAGPCLASLVWSRKLSRVRPG